MIDFDQFVEQVLTTVAQGAQGGADGGEQAAGLRAGLTVDGEVRLRPSAEESTRHHAGYLAGRLLSWLAVRRPVDEHVILDAVAYGAALATPEGQRALPGAVTEIAGSAAPPSAMKAHIFATALSEKHLQRRLDIAVERAFFGWLLEQTGTPATRALVAQMERLRERRLERTGR